MYIFCVKWSNNVRHLITSTIITLQYSATLYHTSPSYTSLHLSTLHCLSFTLHFPLIWLNPSTFYIYIHMYIFCVKWSKLEKPSWRNSERLISFSEERDKAPYLILSPLTWYTFYSVTFTVAPAPNFYLRVKYARIDVLVLGATIFVPGSPGRPGFAHWRLIYCGPSVWDICLSYFYYLEFCIGL